MLLFLIIGSRSTHIPQCYHFLPELLMSFLGVNYVKLIHNEGNLNLHLKIKNTFLNNFLKIHL